MRARTFAYMSERGPVLLAGRQGEHLLLRVGSRVLTAVPAPRFCPHVPRPLLPPAPGEGGYACPPCGERPEFREEVRA
jgi:hypothetical protein